MELRERIRRLPMQYGLAGCAIFLGGASGSLPEYCDARLVLEVQQRRLDETDRYQPRGVGSAAGRCEGSYGQKQSGGDAVLVGVWRACDPPWPLEFTKSSTLALSWSIGGTGDIRTRVQSLAGSLLYRMDSGSTPGATKFSWPAVVLKGLRINRANLMARSWFKVNGENVYLPVAWTSTSEACEKAYHFRFDLVPKATTQAVVTLKAPGTTIHKPLPPMKGSYSTGNAWIKLEETLLVDDGIYEVSVKFDRATSANVFRFLRVHS